MLFVECFAAGWIGAPTNVNGERTNFLRHQLRSWLQTILQIENNFKLPTAKLVTQ